MTRYRTPSHTLGQRPRLDRVLEQLARLGTADAEQLGVRTGIAPGIVDQLLRKDECQTAERAGPVESTPGERRWRLRSSG